MLYQLHRLITWFSVIATPVRLVSAMPAVLPTDIGAHAASTVPYEIQLDTTKPMPVVVEAAPEPNFDTEVLAPLHAEQAAEEAAETQVKVEVEAAKKAATRVHTPVIVAGGDAFAALRLCEAGGDYTRNSGNGYYGAYQYSLGSWGNYGGYERPDLAPASTQDAKAHADQAVRGWSPWPACARKLGLR